MQFINKTLNIQALFSFLEKEEFQEGDELSTEQKQEAVDLLKMIKDDSKFMDVVMVV